MRRWDVRTLIEMREELEVTAVTSNSHLEIDFVEVCASGYRMLWIDGR